MLSLALYLFILFIDITIFVLIIFIYNGFYNNGNWAEPHYKLINKIINKN